MSHDLDLEILSLAASKLINKINEIEVAPGATDAALDAAFLALKGLIEPVRAWAEGADKAAVRAAMQAKNAEINAAAAANKARPVLVSVPAPAAPAAPAPAAPAPAPAMVPVASLVTPPAPVAAPLPAAWARIKSGPLKGEWGACPTSVSSVTPGTALAVSNRAGTRTKVRYVVRYLHSSDFGNVYEVSETAPTTAPAAPEADPAVTAAATLSQAALVEAAQEAAALAEDEGPDVVPADESTLAIELGAISTEAATNAGVAALGSMRGGQLRGVGFSSAQGYVDALAHGVKRGTAEGYKATLRGQYGYTEAQIAALTVTIIPEADLPVGQGKRVTFEGPGIFDQPKAQRGLKVGDAAKQIKSGTALLRAGDLIAGSIAGGAGGQFSWHGAGKITRGELVAALTTIGRASEAPAAKSAHAQAGRAVDIVRNHGYHVHAVQGIERKTLPAHVAHRYIIGRAIVGASTAVGEAYGTRVLTVDLDKDDNLHFTGDAHLAAMIRADFETRTSTDLYAASDVTPWLQRVLRDKHGATRFGVSWYVPHGQVEAAEQLTRAIAAIWGDSWCHGMPVTSMRHMIEGVSEGFNDDAAKHEKVWAESKAEGDKRTGQARAEFLATRAAASIARILETKDRIRGYALLLGDEALASATSRLATLEAEIQPLTDATSTRGALLEFT